MKFTKQSIYIGLFAILYLIVAFSSFFHACAFFGLANNSWMSIILAFAFEVGQAAVLFSLLTSTKDRRRIMPWVLMTTFTLVQVIGNIYSSYKYIIQNSVENLRYFKEPIFIWTELPDAQANVIIVYLVGALLPICSLLLTSMITNYLTDQEELKKNLQINKEEQVLDFNDENNNSLISQNSILQMEKQGLEESNKAKEDEIEQLKKQLEEKANQDEYVKSLEETIENIDNKIEQIENEQQKSTEEDEPNNDTREQSMGDITDQTSPTMEESPVSEIDESHPKSDEELIAEEQNKIQSHFINL